ncbi:MAG TPA: TonB-dependent receptor [Opitutus sp.]|nr:TonB-dependent receptor [Opitutus sp.]
MTPHPTRSRRGLPVSPRKLAAFALGAFALGPLVSAQTTVSATNSEDEPVTLDTYVVSGLRSSTIKALEIKRNSPQILESIVAEDIGKFPDNNAVESLQRLPGIQVTDYGAGNIASVTIRGLPDVTTTLNGRNIFTASGLSLSLQDAPTSLVKQIDVMKTRSAAHIESGMAGVIDIQTFRPFDFPGQKFAIAAKGTYQEQRDHYDPNVSALASKVWKVGSEGKFGALINVSYLTTTYRDQSATPGAQVPFAKGAQPPPAWPEPYARLFPDVVPWTPGLEEGLPTAPGSKVSGVEYVLARDAIFFNETKGQTKRPAANVSLQYAPNKDSQYTFEAFYTGYRNKNFSNLLFSFVDWWVDWTPATLNIELYPGTNIVKSREYIGAVYSFTSGDFVKAQTDSFQYALNGKWNITPDFRLTSEAVYQTSQFHRVNYFSRAYRNVRNDVSVDFNAGEGLPAFRYLDIPGTTNVNESDVSNPATWSVQDDGAVPEVWFQGYKNKGSAATVTTDGVLDTDWGLIKRLKFGVRFDDRKASEASRFAEADRLARNGGPISLSALSQQFPGIVSVNNGFFDGRADIPTSWASIDGEYAYNNREKLAPLYTWRTGPNLNSPLRKTFDVNEFTSAAYLQVDRLETEIGGRRLTGQFGLRFVSIKNEWDFTNPAMTTNNTRSGDTTVEKLLPSAAFTYEITRNFLARLAYGETIRRPNFGDLNPLTTYNRDVSNIGYGTASSGNPNLRATTSRNYDLTFEYYFDEATSAHFALFRREIDGLVVSTRRRISYTDNIGPYDYILSEPTNASNGELEGFEIGGSYFPKNLPGLLQGFGVQGSYTHLSSSQDTPLFDSAGVQTGVRTTDFFLVSDNSFSATLAYERSKFSGRVSYTWRSAFHHHNEAALFANPLSVWNAPERSVTAQISYRLADNFVLTLEGTNLTDDTQHSYYGKNGRTTNNFGNWIVGRTISLGARYSF